LRGLLPSLDKTLDRAPATLTRLSPFVKEASPLVKSLSVTMADLNPMLAYLEPYKDDLITNWTHWITTAARDQHGYISRINTNLGPSSVSSPLKTSGLLGRFHNPFPKPHTQDNPQPFTGAYPRVEQDKMP
ncbi:MAG: hypothetical protein L0H31_08790, partial [Nocardioidaceae bacterium]|nr:hypothetical protein [Nocardioidaceae bacterium]